MAFFAKLFKKTKMKKVTAVVVGAGARGHGYSNYGLDFPERLQMVGVADPHNFNRERMQKEHKIKPENMYTDWADAAAVDKFADCAIICTPDALHKDPAVAFAKKGYHILLEKPMAVRPEDCKEIVDTCKENNVMLAVCHVIRYAPQAQRIKQAIEEGLIGDVVNIQLLEPVGFWHFAHSYVRGAWRNEEESTFSLMAKSCHDIDLILYWMGQTKCQTVSSFGSLHHFTKENKVGFWHFAHSFVRGNWRNEKESTFSLLSKSCHDIDLIQDWMGKRGCTAVSSFGSLYGFTPDKKPAGAGSRCLDCSVEKQCPWSAKKIYMSGAKGFPVNRIVDVVDIENITEALKTGPYGRCVYDCDNDVMDNQVVNMQFEGGATVTFTMVAFTDKVCARQISIFGTKGQLTCDMDEMVVHHYDFLTRITRGLRPTQKEECANSRLHGHGGADFYAMDAFIEAVMANDPSKILTGPDETLRSHLLCFHAEKARKEGRIINPQTEPF